MPLTSLHAKDLARRLSEDLNALRDLDKKNRAESNELIDRIKNFLRSFRPDLFTPPHTNERSTEEK